MQASFSKRVISGSSLVGIKFTGRVSLQPQRRPLNGQSVSQSLNGLYMVQTSF